MIEKKKKIKKNNSKKKKKKKKPFEGRGGGVILLGAFGERGRIAPLGAGAEGRGGGEEEGVGERQER